MSHIKVNKNETRQIIFDNQHDECIQIHAADNSKIFLFIISSKTNEIKAELKNNVELEINFASLATRDTKHTIEVTCFGNSSKTSINSIFLVKENFSCDIEISNIFKGGNNQGSIVIHGIVEEEARCDTEGKIIIHEKATGTKSTLQEKVLLLGKKSVCNAKPILQIDTNDVKANHGASMYRLSEEDLFYMESRGINREEAEKLIKQGLLLSPFAHLKKDNEFRRKLEQN